MAKRRSRYITRDLVILSLAILPTSAFFTRAHRSSSRIPLGVGTTGSFAQPPPPPSLPPPVSPRMQAASDELFRIGNAYEIIQRESVSARGRLKVRSHLAATKGKGCCKDERGRAASTARLARTIVVDDIGIRMTQQRVLESNICSDTSDGCRESLTFSIPSGSWVVGFAETKEAAAAFADLRVAPNTARCGGV